jgi:hypothetical protein
MISWLASAANFAWVTQNYLVGFLKLCMNFAAPSKIPRRPVDVILGDEPRRRSGRPQVFERFEKRRSEPVYGRLAYLVAQILQIFGDLLVGKIIQQFILDNPLKLGRQLA